MAQELAFDMAEERGEGEAFLVDVDGFEGPLDLLLELARRQKVDLARISILALAEQYLAFIEAARKVRLELAADYLVMAAWLAYLKSRLLLPEQPKNAEEPSAAEMAAALAERLRKLELIRLAADKLTQRAQLGRDMFLRGAGEKIETISQTQYQAKLFDLLSAYARQRQKGAASVVVMKQRNVWSLAEAREALERLAGVAAEWTVLDDYLVSFCVDMQTARTVRASSFTAALEMVREGRFDMRQDRAFAPLWVRKRALQMEESAGA